MGSKQRQVGRDARDTVEIDERTRQQMGCMGDRSGGFKTLGYWENDLS